MNDIFPAIAVGALILNEDNHILLVQSPMWNDRYIIPGGHVELGESLEDALRREVKEETNLEINNIKFLMFLECIYPLTFRERRHFVFFDYVCRTRDTHIILNAEATKYVWIKPEESFSLPIETYTKKVIHQYIENMPLSNPSYPRSDLAR